MTVSVPGAIFRRGARARGDARRRGLRLGARRLPPRPDRSRRAMARARRWRRARGSRASAAVAVQHRDRRVDLHALGAFGDQQLRHLALVDRLHLHGGLVGLDLGDDVAGLDGLAFLDQPLGELALLHGGRQRGHQDLGRHLGLFVS